MFKKLTSNNCLNELYKLAIIWCVSSSDIRSTMVPIQLQSKPML